MNGNGTARNGNGNGQKRERERATTATRTAITVTGTVRSYSVPNKNGNWPTTGRNGPRNGRNGNGNGHGTGTGTGPVPVPVPWGSRAFPSLHTGWRLPKKTPELWLMAEHLVARLEEAYEFSRSGKEESSTSKKGNNGDQSWEIEEKEFQCRASRETGE